MNLKPFIALLCLLTPFILSGQASIVWDTSLGSDSRDLGRDIVPATGGGYIVVGNTDENFPTKNTDIEVSKLTTSGALDWRRTFGSTDIDRVNAVINVGDGYVMAGVQDIFNEGFDFLVAKVDNSGNSVFSWNYGGIMDEVANDIIQTSDGGFLVVGESNSSNADVIQTDGANGGYDVWVVKLSPSGVIQWEGNYGGTGNDRGHSVIENSAGNYVIGGYSDSTNGDPGFNYGGRDFWFLEISNTGAIIRSNVYGGTERDECNAIKQTADGGYIMAGMSESSDNLVTNTDGFFGQEDAWVVKISSTGSFEWETNKGTNFSEHFNDILETTDGGFIGIGLTGQYDIVNNYDMFIVRMEDNGDELWSQNYGDDGNVYETEGEALLMVGDDDYVAVGYSNAQGANIDPSNPVGTNGSDVWVLNFAITCNPEPDGDIFVTNTNNAGAGSLRAAIECANSTAGANTIKFNIPGAGPHTIVLTSLLPDIIDGETIIDATTQPGWSLGNIILTASTGIVSPGDAGIHFLSGSDHALYGLKITGFAPNAAGVLINVNSSQVDIGASGKGNVFNSNGTGVFVQNSSWVNIIENYIGLNEDGNTLEANDDYGVFLGTGASGVKIQENYISNHGVSAIVIQSSGHVISNNFIGVNTSGNCLGTSCPGTSGTSIIHLSGSGVSYNNNVIAGAENAGLRISDGIQNNIFENSFFCNGGNGGIFLDGTSANNAHPAPMINATSSTTLISGTSSGSGRVDVFISDDSDCSFTVNCQGRVFLGFAIADAMGDWSLTTFNAPVNAGDFITATHNTSTDGTSEFSSCVALLQGCPTGPTFTVINTNDSGAGSLRQAIECANSEIGPNTIEFNIPGTGPHLISNTTPLPPISDGSLIIDASTQTGWTSTNHNVILDGSALSFGEGLFLDDVSNIEIYGLKMINYNFHAITVNSGCSNFTIGTLGKANVFGNNNFGIYVEDVNDGLIEGNYVGLESSGPTPIPNTTGIRVGEQGAQSGTTIRDNTVSSNTVHGIHIFGNSNIITNNRVGTDNTGNYNAALSSGGTGINIQGNGNTISTNTISSHSNGVTIDSGIGNVITRNSSFCNTSNGIFLLSTGSNNFKSAPIIDAGSNTTTIFGTAQANDIVEVFRKNNGSCTPDLCEGRINLGSVTADGSGNWSLSSFDSAVNVGDEVTATATSTADGTSQFASCVSVLPGCPTGVTVTVSNLNDSGAGSLREAINCANSDPALDNIVFSVSGTISLFSELPTLTDDGIIIDASSMGLYQVILDGTAITGGVSANGLILESVNQSIHGLSIVNFSGNGILIRSNAGLPTPDNITIGGGGNESVHIASNGGAGISANIGSNFTIQNNLIGTDRTGNAAQGNSGDGISLDLVDGNIQILNNTLSGNGGNGLSLANMDSSLPVISNNFIGTNNTGSTPIANAQHGIRFLSIFNAQVSSNTISGNSFDGFNISFSQNNLILSNRIGTDISGLNNIGNSGSGISSDTGFNQIGGPGFENIIAYNGIGANINGAANSLTIIENSFFCNINGGIQGGRMEPTINAASSSNVSGTVSGVSTGTVYVYANDDTGCNGAPCQGKTLLGTSSINTGGDWSAPISGLQAGQTITAMYVTVQQSSNFASCVNVCPTINAEADTLGIYCVGDPYSLVGSTTSNGANITYNWLDSNKDFFANGQTATATIPGTYFLVVDVDGCLSDTVSTIVNTNPLPTWASMIVNNEICEGDNFEIPLTFTGTPPFVLRYDDETGTNVTIADIPVTDYTLTLTPSVSGTIQITSVSDANCTSNQNPEPISFVVVPTINASIVEDCGGSSTEYTLTVNITGGIGNYEVFVNSPNGISGTLMGSTWTSDPIPSGTPYEIDIVDGPCRINRNGSFSCGCSTNSGSMDLTMLETCGNGPITATHNGDEVLTTGELLEFILHDSPNTSLGTILDRSLSPTFSFMAGMSYGTTYYISATAGNDNGNNQVDLASPCLSVSQGTSIVFYENPTATLQFSDNTICEGDSEVLNVTFTGTPPYTLFYSINGNPFSESGINTNDYQLTVTPTADASYSLDSVSTANCVSLAVTGTASTTVLPSFTATLIEEVCGGTNTNYTVSIQLGGGNGTYTVQINEPMGLGGSIDASNIWTSDPIPVGTAYEIEAMDDVCGRIPLSGNKTDCNCTTSAGSMSTTPLTACGADFATATHGTDETLDGDDVLEFVLHDNPGASLGNILSRNDTPSFNFQNGMNRGDTYYISAIAGNDDGNGQVDTNDPCLSVAIGTPVVYYDLLQAAVTSETCAMDNLTYTVTLQILGGADDAYNVSGNAPSGISGSFSNTSTWVSDPINVGDAYDFTVTDGACTAIPITGQLTDCNNSCSTSAGTMGTESIEVCDNDQATATHNGDQNLDDDDALEYILHDNSANALGNILARNNTPNFNFQNGMNRGDTYFISAIAGNDDGNGQVDITDPCLSVAIGTPVIFYELLQSSVTSETCSGDNSTYTVTVDLQGGKTSTYNVQVNAPNGISGSFTEANTWVSDPITVGVAYDFEVTDGICTLISITGQFNDCTQPCTTNAGTMDGTALTACGTDAVAAVHNGDETLDGDDLLEFVLHENADASLGTIWARSNTTSFSFQAGMVNGITYYISAIAGNNDGSGQVDTNDPCLSVAIGTPVVFNTTPNTPSLTANASNICQGDDLVLSTDSFTGTTVQYFWTLPNASVQTTTSPMLTISNTDLSHAGEYTVEVEVEGCRSAASTRLSIVVEGTGEEADAGIDVSLCGENQIMLDAAPTAATGLWTTTSSAVIADTSLPDTEVTDLPAGANMFVWTLSTPSCPNFDADTVFINVGAPPLAQNDFVLFLDDQASISYNILNNDEAAGTTLTILSQPDEIDILDEGGGTYSFTPNGVQFGSYTMEYQICSTTCPDLCDNAIVNIEFPSSDPKDPGVIVPEGMTLNGDGINEIFQINGIEKYPKNEFYVVNRWGDVMYSASPYNNDWEGTHNGKPLPQGTYYYILRTDINNKRTLKGTIYIIK